MKRSMKVISVICIFVFCLSMTSLAQATNKIGSVDAAILFDKYKKTEDYDAKMAAKGKVKQEEHDKMVDEIRRLKDELALLSEDGKKEKQVLIDEKLKTLEEFDAKTRMDLGGERNEAVQEILNDIDKTVKDYGNANKYDFIFNSRVMMYEKEGYDVTEAILTKLNENYVKTKGKS